MDTAEANVKNEYVDKATSGLIDYFEKARLDGIYEERIMRKVKVFVWGDIYPCDCGACGRQFVVSPDGQIGICHEGLHG